MKRVKYVSRYIQSHVDLLCAFSDELVATMLIVVSYKSQYLTCLKRPLKKKTKHCFSRQIIANCRSKVLQNSPLGVFCNTFDLH